MASTYADLKTEIADFLERNDITSVIDTFIDLCEAEMQRKLKILAFETTSTVTVTAGSGTVPTGFSGARSVYWSGQPNRMLRYVPPHELDRLNSGDPAYVNYYTITGTTIKVADDQSGDLVMTYMASFTPLSGGATSNALLTNHPAAYLYGSLVHASVYLKDFEGAIAYRKLFDNELEQINRDNADKKYQGPLVVRAA